MNGDTHRPNAGAALLRRWPTALAVGCAALMLGSPVDAVGEVLPLLPLLYLIAAKIRRRRASWPLLGAGVTAVTVLRLLDVVAPSAVFAAIALVVLVWGAVDGHLRGDGMLGVQALGMLGFGVLALAGLAADPDLGRYLVAAGFLGHTIWDLVHHRLDRVVARSYAEWCGVFDLLIAIQLCFLL